MTHVELAATDRMRLRVQAFLGWLTFPAWGFGSILYMRVIRGHRVDGVENARKTYRAALAQGRPTIVCANHLTMVDSAFLHYGLACAWDYCRDFRRFAWNVPAVENFSKGALLRALVYLGKTIPVDRAGDATHHKHVLAMLSHVVSQGDVCTIFPEGGRSRSGRIEPENVKYGVGQILQSLDRPLVVCAYLRGTRQETWGSVPARGDTMRLRVELLDPTTSLTGMRGARDLSRQVISKLKFMEERELSDLDQSR